MPRENYRERLQTLRGEVAAMADTTLDRYSQAVGVLESGDDQRAREVIDHDNDINEWYLDIESECVELIALQQPVASDLRFIASSFKIATDIERIGDLATNLAAYGRDADGDLLETVAVRPIADDAGEMVTDAMDAYARDDSEAARAVAERDEALDTACQEASEAVVRELMTTKHMDETAVEETLEDVSRALLTIRDLERVGDHAVNICARTLYMVDNDAELIY